MNVGYYTGADALTFADECSAIHRSAFSVSGMRGWTSEEIGALLQRESTFLLKTSYGFLLADLLVDEVEILTIAVSPDCLLYTSPSPRDLSTSRMPSSA